RTEQGRGRQRVGDGREKEVQQGSDRGRAAQRAGPRSNDTSRSQGGENACLLRRLNPCLYPCPFPCPFPSSAAPSWGALSLAARPSAAAPSSAARPSPAVPSLAAGRPPSAAPSSPVVPSSPALPAPSP